MLFSSEDTQRKDDESSNMEDVWLAALAAYTSINMPMLKRNH